MAVTCAGRAPDAELVALLRRLLDMAGDSAAFDTNKLYDGLCRVECAEERIVITRQLREIRASADEAGVASAVLDPIEGLIAGSSDSYPTIMEKNLATLRAGQGCE